MFQGVDKNNAGTALTPVYCDEGLHSQSYSKISR